MKCASCGRESDYSVCGECLSKSAELISIPPVVEIIQCPKCGDFRTDRWRQVTLEEAVGFNLLKEISIHDEFEIRDFHFYPVGDVIGRYRFYVDGTVRDHFHHFETFFEVRLRKIACEKCSRQAGGYYEAILQIRADRRKLRDEEVKRIYDLVESSLLREKGNPKAFVTKIEERKEGIDIFIGDRNLGLKLSRIISKEMGAETKESSKIAGREDGRDFFRFTYLVRLPGFFRGDIVEDEGVVAVVRDVSRRKGYDIRTGKAVRLRDPAVIARKYELKESSVLNVDESTVEILDPFTYQTAIAEKPELTLKIGDRIYVARHGERLIAIHPDLVEI